MSSPQHLSPERLASIRHGLHSPGCPALRAEPNERRAACACGRTNELDLLDHIDAQQVEIAKQRFAFGMVEDQLKVTTVRCLEFALAREELRALATELAAEVKEWDDYCLEFNYLEPHRPTELLAKARAAGVIQ